MEESPDTSFVDCEDEDPTGTADLITLPPTPNPALSDKKVKVDLINHPITKSEEESKPKRIKLKVRLFQDHNSSRSTAAGISSFQAFTTSRAESVAKHQYRFRILPMSRWSVPKYATEDKLKEMIIKGGGILVNDSTEKSTKARTNKGYTINIVDLAYVREHIQEDSVRDMFLPYDCFSSAFIWSQLYHRSFCVEKRNADLNLYRISPSFYKQYDANEVLKGNLTWEKIPPLANKDLGPPLIMREVALIFFPEVLLFPPRHRRVYTRKESQQLLNAVCELKAHGKVNGTCLYEEIAKNYIAGRTHYSLREHFRKTILPHVVANDGYYTISEVDSKIFKAIFGHGDRLKAIEARGKRQCSRERNVKPENDDQTQSEEEITAD